MLPGEKRRGRKESWSGDLPLVGGGEADVTDPEVRGTRIRGSFSLRGHCRMSKGVSTKLGMGLCICGHGGGERMAAKATTGGLDACGSTVH